MLGTPGYSFDNTTGWWETHPQENMVEDDFTSSGGSDSSPYDPKARLFSIFTVVRFSNLECSVGDLTGFCVSKLECAGFGGTNVGPCAQGFGTCCYKAITCGGTSSMNITYMQNPDYGGYTTSQQLCIFSITRASNVCQLRLDFNRFELNNPDNIETSATAVPPALKKNPNNGKCLTDQFRVNSGYSTKSLKYLCGKAPANWHFNVDTRDASNPTTFHFDLIGAGSRIWNVKVTMVDCDLRIPQACGQYFTGTSGTLQSFNWDNGMYLHGVNYAICLRKEKGYCGYTINDVGPSFIVCPDEFVIFSDMQITPAINNQLLYCLNTISSFPIANRYPSTITSTLRTPHYFNHYTDLLDQDIQLRGRQACNANGCRAMGTTNGFYFTWTATKC